MQGISGKFSVVGDRWRFEGYSPEGEVLIDGEQQPMVIRGELDLSGLALDDNTITLGGLTPLAVSLSASNGGLINPLSGAGNLATDGTVDLIGGELIDANGTEASISGTLEINSATVFP